MFSARHWSATGVTVTYTGPLTLPLSDLRTLIAATSEFQTFVGAANATEAAESIHIGGVASPTRPFVLLSLEAFEAQRYAMGARDWFLLNGAVRVMFESAVASENQDGHADAENAALTAIDTIMSAALDLAGSDSYMSLTGFDLAEDPRRSDEDDQDDYYQVPCLASWGQG